MVTLWAYVIFIMEGLQDNFINLINSQSLFKGIKNYNNTDKYNIKSN